MDSGPIKMILERWAWEKAYSDPGYRERKKERDERIKALEYENARDAEEVKNWYLNQSKKGKEP